MIKGDTSEKFWANLVDLPINPDPIQAFLDFAELNPNFPDGGPEIIDLIARSPFCFWVPVCIEEYSSTNPAKGEYALRTRVIGFEGITCIGDKRTWLLLDDPKTNIAYKDWVLNGTNQLCPFLNSEYYQGIEPTKNTGDIKNALNQRQTLLQNAVIGISKINQIKKGKLTPIKFDEAEETPNPRYIIKWEGQDIEILEIDILTGKITMREKIDEEWFETPVGEINRFGVIKIEGSKEIYTVWEIANLANENSKKLADRPTFLDLEERMYVEYNTLTQLPKKIEIKTGYTSEKNDKKITNDLRRRLLKKYGRDYKIDFDDQGTLHFSRRVKGK